MDARRYAAAASNVDGLRGHASIVAVQTAIATQAASKLRNFRPDEKETITAALQEHVTLRFFSL